MVLVGLPTKKLGSRPLDTISISSRRSAVFVSVRRFCSIFCSALFVRPFLFGLFGLFVLASGAPTPAFV